MRPRLRSPCLQVKSSAFVHVLSPVQLPNFISPPSEATHQRSGYHGENAEPVPPPAFDPDELWRQAAKTTIRERLLQEQAEPRRSVVTSWWRASHCSGPARGTRLLRRRPSGSTSRLASNAIYVNDKFYLCKTNSCVTTICLTFPF